MIKVKNDNQQPSNITFKRWITDKKVLSRLAEENFALVDQDPGGAGAAFYNKMYRLFVICSFFFDKEEKVWQHVSLSHKDCLPIYPEVQKVKRAFIGDDAVAYQVHVPFEEHVNLAENCLHLWAPIGHRPIPRFHGTLSDGKVAENII